MKTRTFLLMLMILFSVKLYAQDVQKNQNEKTPIYWLYDAHYRLAMQYSDYDEAKSALYNLIILEPQNDSLLYNLAYIYFEDGKYPSTILSCKDILASNPNHEGALELSGVSFENLGLKQKALSKYEKLYMVTSSINSLYKMAFLQFDLNKIAECSVNIDMLLDNEEINTASVFFSGENNATKEFPMKVVVLNLKGLVNEQQGNKDMAKKAYEDALVISPDFELAKTNLSKLNK